MLNTIANLVSARVPDTLEVAVPLGEAVHAVVALAHRAHEAAERVDLVLAGVAAVLVDLADAELDRCVVLGLDDAAGGAALAGDVDYEHTVSTAVCAIASIATKMEEPMFVFQDSAARVRGLLRSTSSPRSFSMVMSVWVKRRVVCRNLAS